MCERVPCNLKEKNSIQHVHVLGKPLQTYNMQYITYKPLASFPFLQHQIPRSTTS